MKPTFHSHQNAKDLFPAKERSEIENAISRCNMALNKGAAPKIRDSLVESLGIDGWSGEVQIEPPSRITITSLKNGVGLCVQTGGNMSRMYADILKLQKLYMENRVTIGAFILPTGPAAKSLGDNVANADRLVSELSIFKKVIHMPIAVFSFE
ncbi:MAG: restriction endonuclease [Verrucomicrobiaceae bacterium]|nr:MAG: restriction endonuclease [Verrucomicrobiaceae bacterium]